MRSSSKVGSMGRIAPMNRLLPEYYTLGIDPSMECIGIGVVSNKEELVVHGYIRRPKGTSKLTGTEAMEVMYKAFREEFSAIDPSILAKVKVISVEYPFLRSGPKSDPQVAIKLWLFAGLISSAVQERFRECWLSPKLIYTTYSEVQKSLGVTSSGWRASGKTAVGKIIGALYKIPGLVQNTGVDGGWHSSVEPESLNQDTIDAISHARYAVFNVQIK